MILAPERRGVMTVLRYRSVAYTSRGRRAFNGSSCCSRARSDISIVSSRARARIHANAICIIFNGTEA